MPSWLIHVLSMTNCSPCWPPSKRNSRTTASTSVAPEPSSAAKRASAAGSTSPATTAARGSQMRIDEVHELWTRK